MATLVTFFVSLTLIVVLVLVKNLEISRNKKFPTTVLFSKSDRWFQVFFEQIKILAKKINVANTKLIFSKIMVTIRKVITSFKRRFDHKQSYFFTKREHHSSKNKGAVSLFLKDISEHKKSLRENSVEK